MIILSQEKLRDYWDGIAEGFQKSPLEIVLSLIILILLVVVPLVLFLLWRRKDRRNKTVAARVLFRTLSAKKKLSTADIELFETMSSYAPRGARDLPYLLTNPRVFSLSARRMREDGRVSDKRIAALRLVLGLTPPGKRGVLRSTAELTEGLSVTVGPGGTTGDIGVVESVTPDSVAVRTSADLVKGRSVELTVSKDSGLYAIRNVVIGVEAGLLFLEHSEKIKRVQKRRFFRRKMQGTVILTTLVPKKEDEADTQSEGASIEDDAAARESALHVPGKNVKTRLLDLSAGGARVHNPGLDLVAGQAVLLTMRDADKKVIRARATVVRNSQGDSSVSVRFEGLKGAVRDTIARLVLQ